MKNYYGLAMDLTRYLATIIGAFLFQSAFCLSHAETIWCKAFSLGCPTQASEAKKLEKEYVFCQKRANRSYVEGLQEATADPTIPAKQGLSSAIDYAKFRERLTMGICMNTKKPFLNE